MEQPEHLAPDDSAAELIRKLMAHCSWLMESGQHLMEHNQQLMEENRLLREELRQANARDQ